MKNFPEFDFESMGGLEKFQYIPFKDVNSLANINDLSELTTAISPLPGKAIFEGVSIMDTLEFDETQESSNAGDFFKTKLVGMVPKLTSEYLTLFFEMSKTRHIVLVKDNNGKIRCLGYENGIGFKFSQKIEKKPSGINGFSYEFSCQSEKPSPFYMI
jgi:hypothetical protein